LEARAQLVGLLMVGDRVAGRAFSPEDLDLLKCLADQSASTLLSARLGQRLMESKQMEAFQTMSAFFVHDLKNTASTLSLMLQNLPVHFDNPEFRRDALRAVGKTVDHINDLIQRLGLLRRELELKPADLDLNAVVEASLAAVAGAPGVRIEKALGDLPRIRADREQLGKVFTNLVLNARDALAARAGGGRISVETSRDGDGVRVVVRDDGCGMSREFVEKQLFKPFQTTKKNGIGIGMFHSRMIVEAHDGRIEVETEAGVGTAFKVYLPIGGAGERRDG
jgi:putative PEP-CTERM system histidine kinase